MIRCTMIVYRRFSVLITRLGVNTAMSWLTILNREVVACTRCPRLVVYREQIARGEEARLSRLGILGQAGAGVRRSAARAC